MKIRFYLILIFLFIIPNSQAQNVKRVLVEGQIIVNYPALGSPVVRQLAHLVLLLPIIRLMEMLMIIAAMTMTVLHTILI